MHWGRLTSHACLPLRCSAVHSSWVLNGAFQLLGISLHDGYQVGASARHRQMQTAAAGCAHRHVAEGACSELRCQRCRSAAYTVPGSLVCLQAAFAPLRALHSLLGDIAMAAMQSWVIDHMANLSGHALAGSALGSVVAAKLAIGAWRSRA